MRPRAKPAKARVPRKPLNNEDRPHSSLGDVPPGSSRPSGS